MRKGASRGWCATAALVAAVGAALLTPVGAGATDSDLKHTYAFKLDASNGYSIIALAASQRADGQGDVVLFVARKNASAVYVAPALVTATRIEADLGKLGGVSLDVVPSNRKRKLHLRCGSEPETVSFEPQLYRGSFEFRGEEGYADAVSSSPREYTRFFFYLVCGSSGGGETSGGMLPGARLRLHAHRGSFRLDLQANKNRPGARTRFDVETHEMLHGIGISRSRTLWAGSSALEYDAGLGTATMDPPAPFSGRASFHRGAPPGNSWSGNLAVDMPGRSDLPLTGAGVSATLVPACWHQGEGRFRC